MSTTMPSHESTVSEPRETAKHRTVRRIAVKRGFGYFFDAWLFAIVILPVQWGINQVLADNTARYWITAAAASILFFLYRFLMDARAGGTLGKAVVGLRVTTETGGHLGYTRALKRNFYWLIFGPALAPGSNHPQLHIGTVGVDPEAFLWIWVIALAVSIYRDRNSRSFLDRWAGACFN